MNNNPPQESATISTQPRAVPMMIGDPLSQEFNPASSSSPGSPRLSSPSSPNSFSSPRSTRAFSLAQQQQQQQQYHQEWPQHQERHSAQISVPASTSTPASVSASALVSMSSPTSPSSPSRSQQHFSSPISPISPLSQSPQSPPILNQGPSQRSIEHRSMSMPLSTPMNGEREIEQGQGQGQGPENVRPRALSLTYSEPPLSPLPAYVARLPPIYPPHYYQEVLNETQAGGAQQRTPLDMDNSGRNSHGHSYDYEYGHGHGHEYGHGYGNGSGYGRGSMWIPGGRGGGRNEEENIYQSAGQFNPEARQKGWWRRKKESWYGKGLDDDEKGSGRGETWMVLKEILECCPFCCLCCICGFTSAN
ncbi:hypothetical protein BX616_002611 [Lobosporangium transversale]|uniref:Uncharacterized protein n=1 Tax=Lobosporangium transversale TaxID=64571 RepID=A0A1Y2G9M7_9FUNG|nr:hypothetical protein BCR41DRAFT_190362 [Lobosporangium transversale]KAF9900366.1 hypothetical protein BX616_002611 [Lobosporangium transversale]ORZ04964.1 hypothetical protein BCR41DRAFT_190362 [Lobosporangium transversale]|eukprot:XP_021876828.1 hypothetical protein BCR41DRAFT_190362 [Lobosporangium transversale]